MTEQYFTKEQAQAALDKVLAKYTKEELAAKDEYFRKNLAEYIENMGFAGEAEMMLGKDWRNASYEDLAYVCDEWDL